MNTDLQLYLKLPLRGFVSAPEARYQARGFPKAAQDFDEVPSQGGLINNTNCKTLYTIYTTITTAIKPLLKQ